VTIKIPWAQIQRYSSASLADISSSALYHSSPFIMHPVHAFAALAMTGCAAALPQFIPLGEVAEIPAAPITETPLGEGAGTKVIPYSPDAVVAETFASVLADPASADKTLKRRGWDCSEQPLGAGPVPSPDTPEAFLAMEEISNAANNAPVPTGYVNKFKNLKGSNNAVAYLGYSTLDTYDTQACADSCTKKEGCSSFNICKCYLCTLQGNAFY
jgi:hypothetical protein